MFYFSMLYFLSLSLFCCLFLSLFPASLYASFFILPCQYLSICLFFSLHLFIYPLVTLFMTFFRSLFHSLLAISLSSILLSLAPSIPPSALRLSKKSEWVCVCTIVCVPVCVFFLVCFAFGNTKSQCLFFLKNKMKMESELQNLSLHSQCLAKSMDKCLRSATRTGFWLHDLLRNKDSI